MANKDSAKRKTQPPRADDFKSVAKRLECDEDKERFEAKLGKIAKSERRSSSKKLRANGG